MTCLFCKRDVVKTIFTLSGLIFLCGKHQVDWERYRLILTHDKKSITIWKGRNYCYFTKNNVEDCKLIYIVRELEKLGTAISKKDVIDIQKFISKYINIIN